MASILIVAFCPFPYSNGVGVQLSHVVRSLSEVHQVDVLVTRLGKEAYVESVGSARVLRVPLPEGDLAAKHEAFKRALTRQVQGADYAAIHYRDAWCETAIRPLAVRHTFATVFDAARSPVTQSKFTDMAVANSLLELEEGCVRRSDLVLAPSKFSRRYFEALTQPKKIHVVPPGVDVNRFDWDDVEESRGEQRVVYVGDIGPRCGVRVLLRAMVEVFKLSQSKLILVGPMAPDFAAKISEATLELGIAHRVECLGQLDHADIPAMIASATVCVAPSAVTESSQGRALYPTKILEYMACKRAVVAPRCPSVTHLIEEDHQALLFAPGDSGELAIKITALLSDPNKRSLMSEAGYELVRRECNAAATRRSIKRAYAWLAAEPTWVERIKRTSESRVSIATSSDGGHGPTTMDREMDGNTNTQSGLLAITEETGALHLDEITMVEANPITGLEEDMESEESPALGFRSRNSGAKDNAFVAGEVRVRTPRSAYEEDKRLETQPLVEVQASFRERAGHRGFDTEQTIEDERALGSKGRPQKKTPKTPDKR